MSDAPAARERTRASSSTVAWIWSWWAPREVASERAGGESGGAPDEASERVDQLKVSLNIASRLPCEALAKRLLTSLETLQTPSVGWSLDG